jgi:hypothetical protein
MGGQLETEPALGSGGPVGRCSRGGTEAEGACGGVCS